MVRKIPTKKHRGVKDPIKQQIQRQLSVKSKINEPPTDPDHQPIPKSLLRLFKFKKDKSTRITENKNNKNRGLKGRRHVGSSGLQSDKSLMIQHNLDTGNVKSNKKIISKKRRMKKNALENHSGIIKTEVADVANSNRPQDEYLYEAVPFGEVAHEPPTIHTRPRPRPLTRPHPQRNLNRVETLNNVDEKRSLLHNKRREEAREEAVRAYRLNKLRNRK